MRSRMKTLMWPACVGLLLCAIPVGAWADDDSLIPGTQTEIEITGYGIAGPHDKAKFTEYRDFPQGGSADYIWLNHENKEKTYFFDVRLEKPGLDDMSLETKFGEYGQWRLTFGLDRTPHRFQFDAITIFSGLGTRNLRVQDAHQIALQALPWAAGSGTSAANNNNSAIRAAALSDLEHEADTVDEIALERERFNLKLEWQAFDPVTFSLALQHEERSGDRPKSYAGPGFTGGGEISYGLVEPIDYGTSDLTFRAMYDQDAVHLALEYGFQYFEDRNDVVNIDNPFVFTNGLATTAGAGLLATGSTRYMRVSLPPDNITHHFTFEGGVDLPYKTRLNANFTYAWREQDDLLQPYTVNSSVTGFQEDGTPFQASLRANLPEQHFDGRVDTQQFTFAVVSRALDPVELRLKYRLYNFDNSSDEITFPGDVPVDGNWAADDHTNNAFSYVKHQASIEGAVDLPMRTVGTLGYRLDYMGRDEEEEVTDLWDHTLVFALDSRPCDLVQLRSSYEHTWQSNGSYQYDASDPAVPGDNPRPALLPYTRRFDIADKQRDKVNVQFTLHPMEWLTPFVGYTLLNDDYDSEFGLTGEIRQSVNAGFDARPADWLRFKGYSMWQWSHTSQQSRQWSSAGSLTSVGNPYNEPLNEFDPSNWTADNFNQIQTVNFNTWVNVIKDKLDIETFLTHAVTGTHISMDSPVGTTLNDQNARVLADWRAADDSSWDLAKFQIVWHIRKNLTATFGYIYEDFDHNDAHYRDYAPVAINAYQTPNNTFSPSVYGLGIDNPDYTAHTGFCTLNWKF